MRYKVTVRDIELIFDDWEETCRTAEMFVSQGYCAIICGVIEDE